MGKQDLVLFQDLCDVRTVEGSPLIKSDGSISWYRRFSSSFNLIGHGRLELIDILLTLNLGPVFTLSHGSLTEYSAILLVDGDLVPELHHLLRLLPDLSLQLLLFPL